MRSEIVGYRSYVSFSLVRTTCVGIGETPRSLQTDNSSLGRSTSLRLVFATIAPHMLLRSEQVSRRASERFIDRLAGRSVCRPIRAPHRTGRLRERAYRKSTSIRVTRGDGGAAAAGAETKTVFMRCLFDSSMNH